MNRLFSAILFTSIFSISALAQVFDELITITDEPGAQHFPDVAYNSQDNTFLVVWEDVLEDDGDRVEIHGVICDGDSGRPVGEPFVILEDIGDLRAPEIAYNSVDNEFLVVARFEEESLVVAQLLAGDGGLIGGPVDLGNSNGPTFFDPAARARVVSVAHNATDNRYIVAFGGQPSAQILFPNLDLDVPVDSFGDGTNPSVAWSSESNVYLVAWEDREARSTGAENISAQLIASDGTLIGDVIHVRDQEFAEESPRVAYDSESDVFLIVWDERIGFAEGNNTKTDTIGQLVSADGTLVGDPIPFEQDRGYTLRQDVTYNTESHQFLAVWKGDESGEFAFADIYGRAYEVDSLADPQLIYDGGDDNTDEGNSEQYYDESKLPVVTTSANFNFVVWEEAGTDRNPSDSDIVAKFVPHSAVGNVNDWMIR